MPKKDKGFLEELLAFAPRIAEELADPENHSAHVRTALLQVESGIATLRDAQWTDKALKR